MMLLGCFSLNQSVKATYKQNNVAVLLKARLHIDDSHNFVLINFLNIKAVPACSQNWIQPMTAHIYKVSIGWRVFHET